MIKRATRYNGLMIIKQIFKRMTPQEIIEQIYDLKNRALKKGYDDIASLIEESNNDMIKSRA